MPVLKDDGVLVEGLVEDLARVGDQVADGFRTAQGSRGADAAQVAPSDVEAGLQAAHEAGEVSALGAVEGVQFVDDEVLQRRQRIALTPDHALVGADEHVVEHLVVGQEDVRRLPDQGASIIDDAMLRHRAYGVFRPFVA